MDLVDDPNQHALILQYSFQEDFVIFEIGGGHPVEPVFPAVMQTACDADGISLWEIVHGNFILGMIQWVSGLKAGGFSSGSPLVFGGDFYGEGPQCSGQEEYAEGEMRLGGQHEDQDYDGGRQRQPFPPAAPV